MLAFSSFSRTEVTSQKQLDTASEVMLRFKMQRKKTEREREREREREEEEEAHKEIIQVPSTNRK